MNVKLSESAVATPELRQALLGFVQARVRNRDIAEDLVQDILVKATRHVSGVRSPEALPGWLFQIARRRVADHFRGSRATEEFREEHHGEAVAARGKTEREEDVLRGELAAYIRSVVADLPPLHREALTAVDFEGVSQVEYARRAGISVTAAKSRVQRARGKVRATIEACCRWETDHYGTVLDVQPRKRACDC